MRPTLLPLALLVLTSVGRAQADDVPAAPFWGGLEAGPHAVGFDSRWVRDADRPYRATLPDGSDWPADGAPVPRPVLVNRWYPAVADGSGVPMVHGDYFAIVPEDDPSLATYARALVAYGHDVILEQLSYDREGLEPSVRQGWVDELLDTPVPTRRGARPAEGPFPVVLWHSGAGSSFEDNAVFCEFLASRGFVVLGSAFPKGDGSSFNVDTKEDSFADLDLLVALAEADPLADASRVGLAGHSAGAHATFQYVTRPGCPVAAAAALDTTQDAMPLDDPRWSGFVEPTLAGAAHLRAPLLVATGPHAAFLLVDRLDAVDRWLYTSPVFDHNDYIAQGIQCAERWALLDGDPGPAARLRAAYEQLCRDLVLFFRAQLTDDAGARQALDALHAGAVLGAEGPVGRAEPSDREPRRTVPHVAFVPAGTRGPEPFDPASGRPPTPRQLRPLLDALGARDTAVTLARCADDQPTPPVWNGACLWSLLTELVATGRADDARVLWAVIQHRHPDLLRSQVAIARFYAEYRAKYAGLLRSTLEAAAALAPDDPRWQEQLTALEG